MALQMDPNASSRDTGGSERADGRPVAYMLIGIPGAGKSEWAAKHLPHAAVACADTTLQRIADKHRVPYEQVLGKTNFARAFREFQRTVAEAVVLGKDVVLDQINISPESRARKLEAIPASYRRVAVFFPISVEEAIERTERRSIAEGPYSRRVPESVIRKIDAELITPDASEFDEIIVVPPQPASKPAIGL